MQEIKSESVPNWQGKSPIHQEWYYQLTKSILYYKKEMLLTPACEAMQG